MIRIVLALEMGWFKRKVPPPVDLRLALELGPNLVMELRDGVLPTPGDLKYKWDADETGGEAEVTQTYWFIQRVGDGSLSDYVQLSLSVNWRFINLNHLFRSVLGPS